MQADVHLATVIVVICLVEPFSVDNCFKVLYCVFYEFELI